jgi:signal transduction histidine kinase
MAAIAVVVLATLAVTFFVVYRETGTEMRQDIDGDVLSDANQLARAMRSASGGSATVTRPATPATPEADITTGAQLLARARAYSGAHAYRDAQSMLFVIVPGAGMTSNYRDLFSGAPGLAVPRLGYSTQPTPNVGTLRTYEVRVVVGGALAYAGAGQTLGIVSRDQADVARAFGLAGGIVLVLAIFVAYLLAARISAPLRRMANVAERIDGGDLSPRMQPAAATGSELNTLAETFNNMLDRLALAFDTQRQFVADASHELRTPLTVMRGQLDLLARSVRGGTDPGGQSAEVQRVERLLQAELARVSRLVDELLLLAQSERPDFLKPEPVDLADLANELWDGLSLTAARDFQVGTLAPVTIVADPDRLAQALRNLARNAITHTRGPAGVVRIDVVSLANGDVRLSVSDDGPGVPREARERVFERFYRTDLGRTRADGGAGLGLAIVRAIVEAHHGTIAVTDSELGGARFDIELPGATPVPVPELRRPESSAPAPA